MRIMTFDTTPLGLLHMKTFFVNIILVMTFEAQCGTRFFQESRIIRAVRIMTGRAFAFFSGIMLILG